MPLKLKFIVVDRTRSPFLKEEELFFLDRIKKYTQVEWIEVKPTQIKKGRPINGGILYRHGIDVDLCCGKHA